MQDEHTRENKLWGIKDESIIPWIKENALMDPGILSRGIVANPHAMMSNKILFKRNGFVKPGNKIKFSIADQGLASGAGLRVFYDYVVTGYDDYAVLLTKVSIRVELDPNENKEIV